MATVAPRKLTPEVRKKIVELLWLAFTDEQIAFFCELNVRTIERIRAGSECRDIKKAAMNREATYRKRIWTAKYLPAGVCWMLERMYPQQFAKPEIQLQINQDNRQVHQTLIIQAEVAGQINDRVKATRSKITQLLKEKRPDNPQSNGHAKAPDA